MFLKKFVGFIKTEGKKAHNSVIKQIELRN